MGAVHESDSSIDMADRRIDIDAIFDLELTAGAHVCKHKAEKKMEQTESSPESYIVELEIHFSQCPARCPATFPD